MVFLSETFIESLVCFVSESVFLNKFPRLVTIQIFFLLIILITVKIVMSFLISF